MTPQKQNILAAISLLEARRSILGDAVVDEAIMEEKATGKVPFYLFPVKGFYSWLSWKENDLSGAEKYALEALKIQNQAPTPNGVAKWPLLASYIAQNRISEAIPHVQDLLLPYQIKIRQEVVDVMEKAIQQWQNEEIDLTKESMINVIAMAQAHHYL